MLTNGVNILDITQSVLGEYFAMIMLVDLSSLKIPFSDFVDKMTELGKASGLDTAQCMRKFFPQCTGYNKLNTNFKGI